MNEKADVKIISLNQLKLTKSIDDDRYAQLVWSVRNGYPRITVFTEKSREPTDVFDYNTMITATFNYLTFDSVLQNMAEVLDTYESISKKIACYNTKFVNGERTNEIYLQATITVGRDEEGVIYLAVIGEGKKKVKFEILPDTRWTKFYDKDGNLIEDKRTLSNIFAKAYAKQADRLITKLSVDDGLYQKPKQS